MIYISLVYEDDLSEIVMTQILRQFPDKYELHQSYSGNGFGYLKANIKGFNQASSVNPHFMLTDLDTYECPLTLIGEWVNFKMNPNFIFRIAVREIESWLLADREGLSKYFNISIKNLPMNPDEEANPKETLINLARRSKRRNIREDIVPLNQNASIGPYYNGCLSEFVLNYWNIENAIKHSDSLKRAYQKLKDFLSG